MSAHVTVENISNASATYLAERIELDMTPGHSSYFCWSIDCYPTNVSLSTSNIQLAPGQKDSTFIGYLTPYDAIGHEGTSVVKYVFFNENDASDSISAVFVYVAIDNTTAIDTRMLSDEEFFAYPNPAKDQLNIAYGNLSKFSTGRVVVRDLLGSTVKVQDITMNQNLLKINVSDLNKGVYFYAIELDGVNLHTKKFVVSK
jgi:hypothetical protein